MKAKELLLQPNNILFYEDDITGAILYQKVESLKDDIVVRTFDVDFEQMRLGWREMDEVALNSKDFVIFDHEQLETLNSFFTLAYLQD